jgi:hypothetical protein
VYDPLKQLKPRRIQQTPTIKHNGIEATTFGEKAELLRSVMFPPPPQFQPSTTTTTNQSLPWMDVTEKRPSSPLPLERQLARMVYHSSAFKKHTMPSPSGSTNCFALSSPMVTTHFAGGKPKGPSSPNQTSQTTKRPRPTVSSPFSTV